MRLAELKVDGFGILHQLHLKPAHLLKDITLIYGLNETGKSTLLDFIRAMLFGFKLKDGRNPEPLRGGSLGGLMVLHGEGGESYRIERRWQSKKESITLTLPDGTVGGENLLRERLLGGITPLVFRNVFGFGMDELRRLAELSADEVSAHVYGAGTGLSAGKLAASTKRLQDERQNLFKPAGTRPVINQLLSHIDQIEEKIRLLQQEPEHYAQLQQEVLSLRNRRIELLAVKEEAEQSKRYWEGLAKGRESWLRLEAARSQLAALPSVPIFPASGTERLQILEDKITETELALTETEHLIENARNRLKNNEINRLLLDNSQEIKELNNEYSLQLERLRRLSEQAAEEKQAATAYREQLALLGSDFTETRLLAMDISLPVRELVAEYQQRFSHRERQRENALGELTVCVHNADEKRLLYRNAEDELSVYTVPVPAVLSPAEREESLDILELNLRQLHQLKIDLAKSHSDLLEMEQRQKNVKDELAALQSRLLPVWMHFVLALLLAGLSAAAFAGGILIGVLALLAGTACWGAVILAGRRAETVLLVRRRSLEENLKQHEQSIVDISRRIEQFTCCAERTTRDLEVTAVKILGKKEVLEEEIMVARRGLQEEKLALIRQAELQRLAALARLALEAAEQKKSVSEKELAAAEDSLQALKSDWQAWLQKHDLPEGLTPGGVLVFYEVCREAVKKYHDWRKSTAMAEETRLQNHLFLNRLNNLLAKLGEAPVRLETACSRLLVLDIALAENAKSAAQKERIQLDLIGLLERKQRQEAILETQRGELARLLVAGGASDPEEFRYRAIDYAASKDLIREIDAYRRELKVIAGLSGAGARMEEDLARSTEADNTKELNKIKQMLTELTKEIQEIGEQIGGLENQLSLLECGEDLAIQLQDREMFLAALQDQAREWQVRTICLHLLQKAKESHERQRQPAVLQRASRYLEQITAGIYNMVVAPVGQTGQLEVITMDGHRLATANLSRGAASQLYLAVRLALAGQYSQVGLPVFLDDILVDFDRNRLRGAVQMLNGFCQIRQVVMLTCHEHVLESFQKYVDDVGLIRLDQLEL